VRAVLQATAAWSFECNAVGTEDGDSWNRSRRSEKAGTFDIFNPVWGYTACGRDLLCALPLIERQTESKSANARLRYPTPRRAGVAKKSM
jgi:hypothetical protein